MRPTRFFHLLLIAAFALGTGGCLSERILESSAIREQMNPKSVRYSPALGMLIDAESTFHRTTFWGDDDKLIDNIAARKRWIVVPPARVQRDAVFTSGTTGRNAAVYWVRIGDDMRTTGSVRVIPTGLFDGDATPEDFPSEFAAAPHYNLTDPGSVCKTRPVGGAD